VAVGVDRRLIIFDLDGTLIDSSRDLATALNAALRHFAPALQPVPLDVVRAFIGGGAGVLVERSVAHVGLDRQPEEVLPVFLAAYRRCLLETTRLYDGALEAPEALRGDALAVLTNKPGDMSRAILDGLGVVGRFLRVYGGGDLPTRKPDPDGVFRLLDESGVPPEQAAMVGDSAIDVRTGRAAGVRTVGVTYGFDRASFTAEPPDLLIDDLRSLPAVLGCARL
jgi:phosphoglycolate phosphatase